EANRSRFNSGQALDWSRLDFAARHAQMCRVLFDTLKLRSGSTEAGKHILVTMQGTPVLAVLNAIPASLSVAPAREMVGQAFLRDYETADILTGNRGGPLHIIACHRSATEAQATKLLGLSDATVVSERFGIFIADNIQKVQLALIVNCRDESNT